MPKQVLSSWRSSQDGSLVEQDLRVTFHPEDGSYELEASQDGLGIELAVDPQNEQNTSVSKITEPHRLAKFLHLISVGDVLVCVNDKVVVDEGWPSIRNILETLTLSGHPRKLRFLNLRKNSLPGFLRRLELQQQGKMTDLLGFVISMEEYLAEEARRSESVGATQQRDRDWVDYLKAIGGVENLKPAGIFKPSQDLKFMVRRGIPAAYRAAIWKKISLSSLLQQKHFPPNYYQSLLNKVDELPKKVFEDIEKDVDRTFPEHVYFRSSDQGLASLRRVLQAFALHNREIGYCQSLNFVAGMMLIFMEEEDAFFLLLTVVEQLLPADYYTKSMVGTYVDQFVLAHIIKKFLPKIHATLEKNQLQLPLITVQWFMCIFVNTLRPEVALRVWDIFLNEGNKVLFRIAAALFKLNEVRLCEVKDAGDLFQTLREIGRDVTDPEQLVATAYKSYQPSAKSSKRSMKSILARPPLPPAAALAVSLATPSSTSSIAAASAAKNIRQTSTSHISPRLQPMSVNGAVPRDLLGLGLAHLGPADALEKYRQASKAWSESMASRTDSIAAALKDNEKLKALSDELKDHEEEEKAQDEQPYNNENSEEMCNDSIAQKTVRHEADDMEISPISSASVQPSTADTPLSPAPSRPETASAIASPSTTGDAFSPSRQSDVGSDLYDPTFADPALLFQNVSELSLSAHHTHYPAFVAHNQSAAYQAKMQRRQKKARAGQFAFYRADIALWRNSFRPGLEERYHKMEAARKSWRRKKSRIGSLLENKSTEETGESAVIPEEQEEEIIDEEVAQKRCSKERPNSSGRPASIKSFLNLSFSEDMNTDRDVLDVSDLHYSIDHSFVNEEPDSASTKAHNK